jgi:hypothetical protein
MEVGLTEFNIAMPLSTPPGPARFSISNAGPMEHNSELGGNGADSSPWLIHG